MAMRGLLRWAGRPLQFRLLAILALGLASLMFEAAPERYDLADQELVGNFDFSAGGERWIGSRQGLKLTDETPQAVRLWRDENQRRLPFLVRYLPKLEDDDHLRVTAQVRVVGVPPSDNPWMLASLHIEQFDRWSRRIGYWPYRVAALATEDGWREVSRTFPVVRDAAQIRFVAFLGADQGAMEVRQISIRAATETNLARWIGWSLRVGWLLLIVGCVLPLLRRPLLDWSRAAALLLALVIGLGSMLPQPELGWTIRMTRLAMLEAGQDMTRLADAAIERWGTPIGDAEDASGGDVAPASRGNAKSAEAQTKTHGQTSADAPVDGGAPPGAKTAESEEASSAKSRTTQERAAQRLPQKSNSESLITHFLSYALLTVLALLAYRSMPATGVMMTIAALAFATECLQTFIVTRDSELADLGFNAAGIAMGWGLVAASGLIASFAKTALAPISRWRD